LTRKIGRTYKIGDESIPHLNRLETIKMLAENDDPVTLRLVGDIVMEDAEELIKEIGNSAIMLIADAEESIKRAEATRDAAMNLLAEFEVEGNVSHSLDVHRIREPDGSEAFSKQFNKRKWSRKPQGVV